MSESTHATRLSSTFVRTWLVIAPAGMLVVAMSLAGCDGDAGSAAGEAEPEAQGEAHVTADDHAVDADAAVVLTGAEADAAVEAGDAKPYPLDVCIVSGEAIGSMGAAAPLVYNGQQVKFCCPGCDAMFLESPETYLSKLDGEGAGDASPEAGHEHHDSHDHDHEPAHDES